VVVEEEERKEVQRRGAAAAARMSATWQSLLVRIGERCAEYGGHADAEDHIETCYTYLLREVQQQHGNEIVTLLMQCVEELPHKDPLYGTLVGLLNLEDTDFVAKIVTQTHAGIQTALDTDNRNKLRVLIRFLTVLMCSSVIAPGSLIEVYESLLSSAATTIDEDGGGNPAWQPRADFYVFCILASLPWGGMELAERVPEELERVLNAVEAYLNLRRRTSYASLAVFRSEDEGGGGNNTKTAEQEDHLEDLWSRIQALLQNGWKLDSIPKPHLVFEARLATNQSHEFAPLSTPETPKPLTPKPTEIELGRQRQEAEQRFPPRIIRLRIFPSSKTDDKIAPVDRFVVEEYLLDVLFYLNGCRKECAAYMVGLPVPFRYEYLMAETVFSQLLLLPKPPFQPIYYTVVMVDLCKALPGAFPAVVAGAVRALFSRVVLMDVECRTRLVQWLSHHLSNFQFVWPWEEWAFVLDLPKWSPQRLFAKEVLETEVRLAYWDKIKESMAATPRLVELLPPKNTPSFKYSAESKGVVSEAELALSVELTGMVRAKKTVREIQVWIDERILSSQGQHTAIDVVVQTLLYIGSKSFTHTVTVLEKYGQIFRKIAPDQTLQIAMIEAVVRLWRNSAQMSAIVIDRMMGYRMVSNLAIVAWVFRAENVCQFHTSGRVWEILRNAINKTNNRTVDLRKDKASAENLLKIASAATAKAQAKWEEAVALAEDADESAAAPARAKVDWARTVADKAKDEESSAQETVEAKEALLSRALLEQEALFLALYQSFADLLNERLSKPLPDVVDSTIGDGVQGGAEEAHDDLGPVAMELDINNGDGDNRRRNARKTSVRAQEEEEWRRCTLGYLRAISREYCNEVWLLIEKLDAAIFTDRIHPLVLEATYSGLRRIT
jgi:nuclear cap-binding protein subunit 1